MATHRAWSRWCDTSGLRRTREPLGYIDAAIGGFPSTCGADFPIGVSRQGSVESSQLIANQELKRITTPRQDLRSRSTRSPSEESPLRCAFLQRLTQACDERGRAVRVHAHQVLRRFEGKPDRRS